MPRNATDLFKPIVPEKRLNADFKLISTWPGAEPARLMMNKIFETFPNRDENFVEQFQTGAFDARLFELYLYAYLSASGYQIARDYDQPDFIITSRNGITAAIEATTVNPIQDKSGKAKKVPFEDLPPEKLRERLENELPIRFGSPLFSKLQKRYWELPHCRGIPLVFAIEAFHQEGPVFPSANALGDYLYGLRHFPTWTEDGKLVVESNRIEQHQLGTKTIPSNFFNQPNAEHVSAVLFTNSGTFPKFTRMGYQAGLHRGNLQVTRIGHCYNPDPNAADPLIFKYDLDSPPLPETWGQGLMIFFNPNALKPLPRDYFVDAARSYIDNGQLASDMPPFYPFSSFTNTALLEGFGEDSADKQPPIFSLLKSEFDGKAPKRPARADLLYIEKEWYGSKAGDLKAGDLLGIVNFDLTDEDWSYVVLARDEQSTYRAIDFGINHRRQSEARKKLLSAMRKQLKRKKAAG